MFFHFVAYTAYLLTLSAVWRILYGDILGFCGHFCRFAIKDVSDMYRKYIKRLLDLLIGLGFWACCGR